MTPLWTSDAIARAVGGAATAPFAATGVTFDSREVGPGDLFIALKGAATDGHRYLDAAFAAGAAGAIVSEPTSHPHVLVPDTTAALEALGIAARARTGARIVGVTGSVGKTGTKEALRLALARVPRDAPVHASVKSYNNHTGVPLSLARMPENSRFGIFEMGMNHVGELRALTRMVQPDVAIVTWIAPAHREFFSSEEAIADAKGEIFSGLGPGGVAIIPYDSPHRHRLIAHAHPRASRIITFGCGAGADVRATHVAAGFPAGQMLQVAIGDRSLTFSLGMAGAHWVSNALAVIAAVDALGEDIAVAGLALGELRGLAGRGAEIAADLGNGATARIIDESYNANPASMEAALAVLRTASATGRKIAILGAMKELGTSGPSFHAALAAPVIASGCAEAILVGAEMEPLADALAGKVPNILLPDASTVLAHMRDRIADGDLLLIKGSNSLGLGRIVSALAGGD